MPSKSKKWVGILKLTAVYAIFTAVISFIVISSINASIVVDTSSPSTGAESKPQRSGADSSLQVDTNASAKSTIPKSAELPGLTGIPSGADCLSFSSDGRYCIYCFKGTLHIIDIQSGKTVSEIADNSAITYAMLMYDRNIVIYFTAGRGRITVNTYNIDTDARTLQNSFKTDNGAVIRQADYSSMTGHVCFDVNNGKSEVIYYIDLMKKLNKTPFGGTIENMALANNMQTVYYEKGSKLYCQSQPVKSLEKIKTRLLGCDMKDYVYVQSQSDKTYLYVVKGVNILKTIRLADAGFIKTYSNKNDIYLVYPDYILNLSTDPTEKTAYDKNYDFKGLIGNHIYLSDGKGNIRITSIKQ